MNKFVKVMISSLAVVSMVGCSNSTTAETSTPEASASPDVKSEGVMTYDEYVEAAIDSEVTVETYVQAKQSWWEDNGVGKATLYTQDQDGAYFIYDLPISEEDYNKLEEGTKIKVTGYKAEWSGEVEIIDGTYEILDGNWIAEPLDVTDLLADEDELIKHQNEKVTFTDMTVEASDNGEAFTYNWDGSGTQGDDVYFNVSKDGNTYSFLVESYLCDSESDVYKAAESLEVGDTIDMEGYLYWYEGVNPHITSISVK